MKQTIGIAKKIHSEIYSLSTLPSVSVFRNEAKKKIVHQNSVRVSLLASFTLTGLEDVITVLLQQMGVSAQVYVGPYKQYEQEIRNTKSGLYASHPQISFLLLDPFSLFHEIDEFAATFNAKEIEEMVAMKVQEITELIDLYLTNLKAPLIVSLVPSPPTSSLGVSEMQISNSRKNMIVDFNRQIRLRYISSKQLFFYDFERFIMHFGWTHIHDSKLYFLGKYFVSPSYLPYLGYELTGYIKAVTGKTKKCIVVDLDNTLWGGIIGEDGLNGIKLGPEPPGNAYMDFQKTLLSYFKRGVILAINSNNNEKDALEVFAKHPSMVLKNEHFAVKIINWNDKVANMKHIAQKLNIGLDSLVFIDDDPKKREMMRTYLPEVLTPELPQDPALYSDTLKNLNDFTQMTFTREDFNRGVLYTKQIERETFKEKSSDLKDYLRKLQVKVVFTKISDFSIPRIAQLTQRTNQFNLTTRRYTEADIIKFSTSKSHVVYAIEVIDKFGSYGIVGVAIIEKVSPALWKIDSLLLSCRALGLEIEKALMSKIVDDARTERIVLLQGEYIPTAKNVPASHFYKESGFNQKNGNVWELELNKTKLIRPAHILVEYA